MEHLLHIATSHLIAECVRRGVKEIAIGDLNGIRESINYGDWLNQRLHAWPYRKLINMLKYKGALVGILVRDKVDEKSTSVTCHVCRKVMALAEASGSVHMLLRLEGTSGCERCSEYLLEGLLGISCKGV